MATEAPSVGVMTSNYSMDGMDMPTEAPSTGMDIDQYDEFLEQRRQLMAQKMRDYYYAL